MKRWFVLMFAVLLGSIFLNGCASAQQTEDSSQQMMIVVIPLYIEEQPPTPGEYFPEYAGGCPDESKAAYSLPNFNGKKCFWVQYWNEPAFFAETLEDTSSLFPIMKDGWDYTRYDGYLLVNPEMASGKAYFTEVFYNGRKIKRYFQLSALVQDPRMTNYWMLRVADPASKLFEAIEQAAGSQNYPEITKAILDHIIACNLVKKSEVWSLTPDQITTTMLAYTDIALNHHLETVRKRLADSHLTEVAFKTLHRNDTLELYFDSRYGPVTEPAEQFVVFSNYDGIVTAGYPSSDTMLELTWYDVEWLADFITVKAGQESY